MWFTCGAGAMTRQTGEIAPAPRVIEDGSPAGERLRRVLGTRIPGHRLARGPMILVRGHDGSTLEPGRDEFDLALVQGSEAWPLAAEKVKVAVTLETGEPDHPMEVVKFVQAR